MLIDVKDCYYCLGILSDKNSDVRCAMCDVRCAMCDVRCAIVHEHIHLVNPLFHNVNIILDAEIIIYARPFCKMY